MSESIRKANVSFSPPTAPPSPEGSRFARAHHVLLYFLGAVLVVWLLSGIYQVQVNQVAVVERLGEYVSSPDGKIIEEHSGLHYHLPWPIDRVQVISLQEKLRLDVDTFNTSPSAYQDLKDEMRQKGFAPDIINGLFDPYLVTGDKSIVNMQISMTYHIRDAGQWLTQISHETDAAGEPNDMRQQLFRQLAQRAMIHQIGRMQTEEALFTMQGEVPRMMLDEMREDFQINDQTKGTKIDLGLEIERVDVPAGPKAPALAASAYTMVNNARQMLQSRTKEAEQYASGVMTRAEAERDTMVVGAKSYANQVFEEAKGEKARFAQVLEQYHKAPDVTRFNLYTDAVSTITRAASRIYVAVPGQRTILEVEPAKFDPAQTTRP